jgi:hypothetical protein
MNHGTTDRFMTTKRKLWIISIVFTFIFVGFPQVFAKQPYTPKLKLKIFESNTCTYCYQLKKKLQDLEHLPTIYISRDLEVDVEFINIDHFTKGELEAMGRNKNISLNVVPESFFFVDGQQFFIPIVGSSVENMIKSIEQMAKLGVEEKDGVKSNTFNPYFYSNRISKWRDHTPSFNKKNLTGSQVVILSSSKDKTKNSPYIGNTIKLVKKSLKRKIGVSKEKITTLYGYGSEKDNLYKRESFIAVNKGQYSSHVEGVFPDEMATIPTITKLFDSYKSNNKAQNRLFIFLGHGTEKGMEMWNEEFLFTPDTMKNFNITTKGTNVIVSEACNGGVFSKSSTCGFYSSVPGTSKSNCLPKSSHEENTTGYLTTFLKALDKDQKVKADLNQDKQISFLEAHYFAFRTSGKKNIPFTKTDFLVDIALKKYFNDITDKKVKQYKKMDFQSIIDIAKDLNLTEEKTILEEITPWPLQWLSIDLTNRNGKANMIARKIFYYFIITKQAHHFTKDVVELNREVYLCERASIREFLEK